MLKGNKLGGINETDKAALNRAKEVDLITLPKNVEGTNCYNCKWISSHEDERYDASMCTHPKVRQYVNERMCCILWTSSGEYRPFKREKEFEVKVE